MPELVSMYYPEKNNDKKIVEVKVNYTRDASVSERLEKARIRVIDRLEELEAVERNTAADGTDFLVVDQVRLLEVFDKRMLESASSVVWKDSGNLVVSAFNVFEGVPVVEKQEFEDADDEIVLKNLFTYQKVLKLFTRRTQ
jgi:hypothetical protein